MREGGTERRRGLTKWWDAMELELLTLFEVAPRHGYLGQEGMGS